MPSFELNKLQAVTGLRALAESDASAIATGSSAAKGTAQNREAGGVRVEIGAGVDTAQPPVDTDRVVEVREALRDGTYPLVPAKIADAMIAAQLRPAIGD